MSGGRITSLALGVRFAFAGGRGGWTRAAMTAVGVGLGVALLLVAASIPTMLQERSDRGTGRAVPFQEQTARSDSTVLVRDVADDYRGTRIYAWLVKADGTHPVLPPGVATLPGNRQAVVSPALQRLLASDRGALLRPRFPYAIVGTIADQGLLGPNELAYYAGDSTLSTDSGAQRTDRFGDTPDTAPFPPVLVLLAIIGFVVLLVPVAVFVGTAVRFGGDGRDRRLAALRLVGADRRMARWISAGEALAGAALGVLVGAVLLFAFRVFVSHVSVWDISVYGHDVRPQPVLAGLIVLAVPVLAVVATLLALRRVSIEPLGVVRRATGRRRRIWWRLLVPVVGLLVLLPAVQRMRSTGSDPSVYTVAAGVTLLLVGVTTLLPWLVEAVVRRLRGGGVPWQLATRRLQLDSGTAARLVSGIAVAVAGGIGLQMLFAGVEGGFLLNTGQDPSRYQVVVNSTDDALTADTFTGIPGVIGSMGLRQAPLFPADNPDIGGSLIVADCATLSQLAVLDSCTDGDVFLVTVKNHGDVNASVPAAGSRVNVGTAGPPAPGQPEGSGLPWQIPAAARSVDARVSPAAGSYAGVYATPGALHGLALGRTLGTIYLAVDPSHADVIEEIRDASFVVSPRGSVMTFQATRVDSKFANVRRGLFIGVIAVLLLIGASLLVSMLEQLAERRRLLAMLVAVGTRRATLGWSLLWQATIPMLLGLTLALVTGTLLGAILLRMVRAPVAVDWADIGAIAGVAGSVVLAVTGLSLPVLHRLMRSGGLRTE